MGGRKLACTWRRCTAGMMLAAAPAARRRLPLIFILILCASATAAEAKTKCGPLAPRMNCPHLAQCCSKLGICGTGRNFCGVGNCVSGNCAAGRLAGVRAWQYKTAEAHCSAGHIISSIVGARWGYPPSCNATNSYSLLAAKCRGKPSCSVPATSATFGINPCPGKPKMLTFSFGCTRVLDPPRPAPKPMPSPRPSPSPRPQPSPRPVRPVSPSPMPPQTPFVWKPLTPVEKKRAEELLTIFENSSLEPEYGYAENLGDGRGITFGRVGFCTGTSDGLLVVKKYVELKPVNNTLAKYLPALQRIDDNGGGGDVAGLDGFMEAVEALGTDPLFRRAQDVFADQLYYNPSQTLARSLGLRYPLSKAQMYDAYVQHGESDPDRKVYSISANGMAAWVNAKLGGSPLTGVDERVWLSWYLLRRRWALTSTTAVWAASVQRVDLFRWMMQVNGLQLNRPIWLSYERCTATGVSGPCTQQTAGRLSFGGIIYGDFRIL